ncbi:outer membrane lipoprotein-sorting protein [Thauera sp. GDN1]|uniref:outer membrane lipoprotein-sorting protein n=1 Tax=Thauera sp. GDN1 TaxID=2944810 RepID=UPI0024796882|nr:outer membrane lipoprotein-sorting protein [Thauera sp. GDN1]
MNTFSRALAGLAAGLLIGSAAGADDAGLALAQRVYDRPDGKDASSVVTMSLTEEGRSPRVRSMVLYRLSGEGGEVATLIRFTDPADIAGTGLLTLDAAYGESSQWIYLPAMQRVRRVDSSRKGGRFVNSDYYFEDLRDRKPAMDTHRVIGQESIDGVACEVLESVPVEAGNSVYLRRVSWIDPVSLLPLRVDFYEKDAERPAKRLEVAAREQVQGYWTVTDSTMTDLRSGHRTRLVVERIAYDRGLPARLFSSKALEDEAGEKEFRP